MGTFRARVSSSSGPRVGGVNNPIWFLWIPHLSNSTQKVRHEIIHPFCDEAPDCDERASGYARSVYLRRNYASSCTKQCAFKCIPPARNNMVLMQDCVSSGYVYLHRCRLGWGGGSQGAVTTQREKRGWRIEEEWREGGGWMRSLSAKPGLSTNPLLGRQQCCNHSPTRINYGF